jgi:hypothetical protein
MTRPTIPQSYARHFAAFCHRTPFGVLLQADREALIKSTARDAGVTVQQVKDWLALPLSQAILAAEARYAAMTPAERRAMWDAQRRGYVRAEAGFGSDADESAYRAAHARGDTEALARLDAESEARMQMADRIMEERHG